ncbi:hypothetical protein EJ02DRAFT_500512 [Clathrospora elynae]|uniref:Uncharacterized protein n=1 Tax=Clathrospora elynae TaxID=706981 RepID=A0A6A5T1M9_9PLEO|nr:hypothetical protein EJ02DRAFT_500512 [Clathrospora elynae]
MSQNEKHSLPPPYSEYTSPQHQWSTMPSSRGQTLLEQVALTRTHHIHSIIETHIIPLIEQRATYGIAQTTIALLPSDITLPVAPEKSEYKSFDSSKPKPVEVIGFSSSDEEPTLVRLEGQLNSTEFWRSHTVVVELERLLGESLNANPLLRTSSPNDGVEKKSNNEQLPTRQARRSLLSRVMPSLGPELRSPSGNPEVGVSQLENTERVLIQVRLEEMCLRTLSDFNLYDTISKQCVFIRVDARC